MDTSYFTTLQLKLTLLLSRPVITYGNVRFDRANAIEPLRVRVSVKYQFAKNIRNFREKGECGALAMIYLVRLSRLGGPDVL